MPRLQCAKPQEWNSGAAIIVVSRAFSGIRSSSAAIGSIDFGCARLAPFGVPVVPEVRIVALPGSFGGLRFWMLPLVTRSSRRVSPDSSSGSCQAMKRLRSTFASPSRPANSWS